MILFLTILFLMFMAGLYRNSMLLLQECRNENERLKEDLELTKQILRIYSSSAGAKDITVVSGIKFNDEEARRN